MHGLRDALRRLEQPLALGILAEQRELPAHERGIAGVVDRQLVDVDGIDRRAQRRPMADSGARLLTVVLDIVVLGLPEHEPRELSPAATAGSSTRQMPTMMFSDVGITPCMNGTSRLKFLWSIRSTACSSTSFSQHAEVEDVAGALVDRAAHGHVEDVVVPVPVRVVALAEQPRVLLVRERGIVHAVRRVEVEAAGHGDDGHWRGGVSASVRRDTNAARRTGVPDGLAKMTPRGHG